ncbi:hypothetical protein [Mesorhizobium sp. f-mel]
MGRRLAEMLPASIPAFAGPEGTRIIREVWPPRATAIDPPPKLTRS